MSNYHGRRGPNVSQYLAELNTIQSPEDMAAQNPPLSDDDFALFTNAEFFDFDLGDMPDLTQPVDYDPSQEERTRRQNASAFRYGAAKPGDGVNGDFSFPVYPNYQNVVDQSTTTNYPQSAHASAHYQYSQQSSPTVASPNEAHALPGAAGGMHGVDAIHDQSGQTIVEEAARVAAEEDKRRRNTAASARFRIKKKQREQALERTAKEMTDKVQVLESKVSQLEMENKWLKSLITEKNENRSDMTELYKKFTDKRSEAERSTGERNDGVGTREKTVKNES